MTCFPVLTVGATRECHCSLHSGPLVSSVSHLLQRESQAVRPAASLPPEATHTPGLPHERSRAGPACLSVGPALAGRHSPIALVVCLQVPLKVLTVSVEMPVSPS